MYLTSTTSFITAHASAPCLTALPIFDAPASVYGFGVDSYAENVASSSAAGYGIILPGDGDGGYDGEVFGSALGDVIREWNLPPISHPLFAPPARPSVERAFLHADGAGARNVGRCDKSAAVGARAAGGPRNGGARDIASFRSALAALPALDLQERRAELVRLRLTIATYRFKHGDPSGWLNEMSEKVAAWADLTGLDIEMTAAEREDRRDGRTDFLGRHVTAVSAFENALLDARDIEDDQWLEHGYPHSYIYDFNTAPTGRDVAREIIAGFEGRHRDILRAELLVRLGENPARLGFAELQLLERLLISEEGYGHLVMYADLLERFELRKDLSEVERFTLTTLVWDIVRYLREEIAIRMSRDTIAKMWELLEEEVRTKGNRTPWLVRRIIRESGKERLELVGKLLSHPSYIVIYETLTAVRDRWAIRHGMITREDAEAFTMRYLWDAVEPLLRKDIESELFDEHEESREDAIRVAMFFWEDGPEIHAIDDAAYVLEDLGHYGSGQAVEVIASARASKAVFQGVLEKIKKGKGGSGSGGGHETD